MRVGLAHVCIHDLKHTFGRRLRAAGVSFEDRQDLLGHKSGRIITHYSAAEISNLIAASNKVCQSRSTGPALTLLKRNNVQDFRTPAKSLQNSNRSKSGLILQMRKTNKIRGLDGGSCRIRTYDQLVKSQLLYRLS